MRETGHSKLPEVVVLLSSTLVRPPLESSVWFWAPLCKREPAKLERVKIWNKLEQVRWWKGSSKTSDWSWSWAQEGVTLAGLTFPPSLSVQDAGILSFLP